MSNEIAIETYQSLLDEIRNTIQQTRLRTALSVNAEMILLYWQTGKMIAERQQQEGWSAKVIPRLAADLRHEFTSLKGFSERNLSRMLAFYKEYQEDEILPQPVAKLPWGHNILLMEKIKDKEVRHWYMQQTVKKNWSRDLLLNAIKMDMYSQTQTHLKSNNFNTTLPATHADYANEIFQDQYNLGFLGITTY